MFMHIQVGKKIIPSQAISWQTSVSTRYGSKKLTVRTIVLVAVEDAGVVVLVAVGVANRKVDLRADAVDRAVLRPAQGDLQTLGVAFYGDTKAILTFLGLQISRPVLQGLSLSEK